MAWVTVTKTHLEHSVSARRRSVIWASGGYFASSPPFFLSTPLPFQHDSPWTEVRDGEKWWPTTFIYHLYPRLGQDSLVRETGKEFETRCQDLQFCSQKSQEVDGKIEDLENQSGRNSNFFSLTSHYNMIRKQGYLIILLLLCSLFSNITFVYNSRVWQSGLQSRLLAAECHDAPTLVFLSIKWR